MIVGLVHDKQKILVSDICLLIIRSMFVLSHVIYLVKKPCRYHQHP